MLPYAQHLPAELAEGAGDEAVAGAVGGDLLPPEGGVVPGLDEMPRAPVPEAAVNSATLPYRGKVDLVMLDASAAVEENLLAMKV